MEREVEWKDRKRTFFGLPWSFTKYSLTKDRLFIEKGILNVREDEVRLYRITDLAVTRSFGQRIFGLGTISCCSADKTLGDFQIINIKDATRVKEIMSQLIESERMAKRVISKEDFAHNDNDDIDDSDDDN